MHRYALLDRTLAQASLFSSLWHVALEFHECHERWYNGPLVGLDATDIERRLEDMRESANTLSRSLTEHPAARRIADAVRTKLDKFCAHLPILRTLCNPGLRERHWVLITEVAPGLAGVARGPDTSLADMIDAGLGRVGERLEEIG